jgi:hypothetical protein
MLANKLRRNLAKLAFRQSFLRGVIFDSIPGASTINLDS